MLIETLSTEVTFLRFGNDGKFVFLGRPNFGEMAVSVSSVLPAGYLGTRGMGKVSNAECCPVDSCGFRTGFSPNCDRV